MKKTFCICNLLLMLILLSSCGHGENVSLAACGTYSVPGMVVSDMRGESYICDVLERDTHGRILFEFTAKDIIFEKERTVTVICQKYDSNYVYFYENICFAGYGGPADIESLKETNDWNKPLVQEKMSKRINKTTFDLILIDDYNLVHNKARRACYEKLGIEESGLKEFCFVDSNGNGKYLMYVIAEINGEERKGLAIIDDGYNVTLWYIATETELDIEKLVEFKQNNGW